MKKKIILIIDFLIQIEILLLNMLKFLKIPGFFLYLNCQIPGFYIYFSNLSGNPVFKHY